jgi:uncharacterized protein YjdB
VRSNWRRIRFALLATACVTASGCPNACDVTKELIAPTNMTVTVAPAQAQLTVGQTQQFTATVLPESVSNRSVTWSVTPAGTATIDAAGLLTALAPGQAVVTATTAATPSRSAQAAANISAASRP